jgi:hypothetical protein
MGLPEQYRHTTGARNGCHTPSLHQYGQSTEHSKAYLHIFMDGLYYSHIIV